MKLTEQVESLRDENYKLKKQLKEVQEDNGNEKKIDNKENNHVEKGKIQVKGKDKESKQQPNYQKRRNLMTTYRSQEEHTRNQTKKV